jgi:hypothetical protein
VRDAAYRKWVAEAWPELCSSARDRALLKGAFTAGWDAHERPAVNPPENNMAEAIDRATQDVLSMIPEAVCLAPPLILAIRSFIA